MKTLRKSAEDLDWIGWGTKQKCKTEVQTVQGENLNFLFRPINSLKPKDS